MAGRTEVMTSRGMVSTAARPEGLALFWQKFGTSYLFMAPFLIFFTIFVVAPVLTAVYLSFTYFNVLEAPRFIGWSNYKLLFLEDDVFIIAIANTLTFAVITGPVGFFLSFMFAWLINPLKLKTPLALCFYAPSITGAVAMGVVWKIVFSGDRYGYLNNWLLGIGAIDEPYQFLAEQAAIMPVIMFVALWMSMGTGFLVFLAGLQTVPGDLYEAGKMDGIKNPLQEVWYITLPMIKRSCFSAVSWRWSPGSRSSRSRHRSLACQAHCTPAIPSWRTCMTLRSSGLRWDTQPPLPSSSSF